MSAPSHMNIKVARRLLACLLLSSSCGFAAPVSAGTGAVRTVPTVAQLSDLTASDGDACMVLGYDHPADGGGGMFFRSDASGLSGDGGTVFPARNSGFWRRLDDGRPRVSWYGVFPVKGAPQTDAVDMQTRRLQNALRNCAGGVLEMNQGEYFVSDTLIIPANTRLEGRGPVDVSTWEPGGTVLRPFGEGTRRKWQDTGDPDKDSLRPLIVCGGSNVGLRNIGLLAGGEAVAGASPWEVGVLMPATKRCTLEHVAAHGWSVAACLLDATWSDRNQPMIALHEGRISPSSMNECTIQRCFLSGLWGLMIRGVDVDKRDPRDYLQNPGDWLWSYGGTSDLNVIACRIEGKASPQVRQRDGGAFYSDAPLNNAHKGGQGHRFVACNFRTNTRHMLKLGSTHRDSFFGCYFEGRYVVRGKDGMKPENRAWLSNDSERTGWVRFVDCRFTTVDIHSHWDMAETSFWPPISR